MKYPFVKPKMDKVLIKWGKKLFLKSLQGKVHLLNWP